MEVRNLIHINDRELNFQGNIKELLNHLGYELSKVVVLVNNEILKREKWESYEIKENDYIEIVSLVGGG